MHFSDFLKNCLVDNSSFTFLDEETQFGISCFDKRLEKKIRKFASYNGENQKNSPDRVFGFLRCFSSEINNKLRDKDFIKRNLVLFGDEYEHNTENTFFTFNEDTKQLDTGNLVGFASGYLGEEYFYNINITSRFGNNFLKHLIASSDGFLEIPDHGEANQSGLAEWLLIFLWKEKLKHAYRLGLPKEYVNKANRSVPVRGNLKMSSVIINPTFIPPYECIYREHSFNNVVTQLIANTFRLIRDKSLIQDCHKIKQDFIIATDGQRVAINQLLSYKPINNPYFSDYSMVTDLSKRIIRKEMADFSSDSDDFSAFFFDISMLFEYFIRKVLNRKGYIVEEKKNDQYFIPSGGMYNNGLRRMFPDIIIDNGDGSVDVFDVKYKRYDFRYGVSREDLFQMNTYVSNILNNRRVRKCGFIYPIKQETLEENNSTPIIKQVLKMAGLEIAFEIHFFIVPDENAEAYSKQFNDCISKFYYN